MENNFDLKKFLVENKLTKNAQLLEDIGFADIHTDYSDYDDYDDGDDDGDDDSGKIKKDKYGYDKDDPDKWTPKDQKDDPTWKVLKSKLTGVKDAKYKFIRFTDYDTDHKVETMNWGTMKEAGHSIGVGAGMSDDGKFIQISVVTHTPEDEAAMKAIFAGIKQYSDSYGYKVPSSEISKVIEPLKLAAQKANTSPPEKGGGLKVGGKPDVGSNTGQMGPGPITTPKGNVSNR